MSDHNRRRARRGAIATAAIAGLAAAVLAACGSNSPSASSSGQPAQAQLQHDEVQFSSCMRSHGVSSFPDPNSSGQIPKDKVTPLASSPEFRVAEGACQHLLPNTSAATDTHAEVQAALSGMVRFAACMRSHGVQRWPDPTVDRSHLDDPRPVFDLHSLVDPSTPRISTDIHECQHLMPQSTSPYVCSRVLAERIPGSPPDAEACDGGSATVP
ncbi:MAG TPA: hypothetical protein VGH56_11230 [Solirubrobacteraceae bacterium]